MHLYRKMWLIMIIEKMLLIKNGMLRLLKYSVGNRIFILLLVFLYFPLAACDPAVNKYQYEELSGIVRVELIQYDNNEPELINTFLTNRHMQRFNFNKEELIETMDSDKKSDFIKELSEITLNNHWWQPDSHSEICLKIIYKNDDFQVISYSNSNGSLVTRYNKDGLLTNNIGKLNGFGGGASQFDRSSYIDMINRYFEVQVE